MKYSEIRKQLILAVIELHNHFILEWNKFHSGKMQFDLANSLWNANLVEAMYQRYYIVEHQDKVNSDYDNPVYETGIEVRYLLRSGEAAKYPKTSQEFLKRYRNTVKFSLTDIENIEEAKRRLTESFSKEFSKNQQVYI